MEIRERLTISDLVENQMDLMQRSNVAKQNIKKRRAIYLVISFLGVILFGISIPARSLFLAILSGVYLLWGLFEAIFAKNRYLNIGRKNMKRNMELTAKQFNIDLKDFESVTKFNDEEIIMEERGTSTIYLKSDFVQHTENARSYIFEFTNGRFIYFKKDTFTTKENYLDILNEIGASKV